MRIADLRRQTSVPVLGFCVVLLAVIGGHFKGRADGQNQAGVSRGNMIEARGRDAEASRVWERDLGAGSARPASGRIQKRLHSIWKESPDPTYDFEMIAESKRLLERMTSAEIAEFLQSIPPGFERRPPYSQMSREIVFWWIFKDGPAALAHLGRRPDADGSFTRMMTTQAFMIWTAEQPDAGLAWLKSGNLTSAQQEISKNLFLNGMMTLVEENPDRAFQELAHLGPEEAVDQLRLWAETRGQDPETRRRILDSAAGTGRPEDLEIIRRKIAASWGASEPDAALAYIDSLHVTDAERQHLEACLALGKSRKEPQAALDTWLERNATATLIPAPITRILSTWMMPGQEPVIQWLNDLPAGALRDAIYADSIRSLTGFDRYANAAEMAGNIESPELRAKALQTLDQQWSLARPHEAAKWKAGLTSEDQERLEAN